MLEIKNLTVKVKNDTPILTDVSLSIDEGTCIGLTGASGSGKTTLIKSIMGMNSGDLEIAQGQILLDGDNLLIHGAKERRALCGKTIGFIPQNPMTAFFPHAKMERQIIETLRMHTGLDKKQAHALAENVLRQVNLTDTKRVLSAYPGELSGGMLQRIAMALILGTKPKYVLADEPTSALDEANRDLLLELLRKYQKTAAILFISHDTEAMKALCPITHVMERGKIIETQATEQLFIHPQQPWTKRFAELDNLTRTYYDAQGETFCALDHAALIWEQGHSIAIMGESGSGKSTLARLMIGLERPSEGRILINGVDTTKWSLREWRKYRGKIQAVFQDAGGTLNPAWSTSKNVEEALVNLTDLSPSQRKNRIAELMEQTGLSKNLLDTPVRRLSGGEQRRLALLRSLSISPEFLILDEVTAGLDLISTEAVLQLLEKYEQEHDCAYLVITHDLQIASRLCEVIYEIEHGKITKKAVR